ncbi:MAG: insulinase family protein [Candidatus Hatepunaea meridiana]|nr:insulinase family protein [Candidatus Hatepunaea meridiana]
MIINKVIHGFRLIRETKIEEILSVLRQFEHQKSGAHLVHLGNDDDNKVFAITFKTLPEDHMGIPHILEHSIFNGSMKFPVKNPFVEFGKGSLSNSLNASTSKDSTTYYCASTNSLDILNLMDLFLDGVFNPTFYSRPEILKQEGWRYELNNHSDDLIYNGVVYNEMKGAFSSPMIILLKESIKPLFPDNSYFFESGGYPTDIPKLTKEKFLAFHEKYYHPSNCYIYLYGDGNLEEYLKFINEEYLSDFNRSNKIVKIQEQIPFKNPRESRLHYPASHDEKEKDKHHFCLGFTIGKSTDPELVLALTVLEKILMGTPDALLTKELISKKIGTEIFGYVFDNYKQPVFNIIIKNSSSKFIGNIRETILETLSNFVNNGIDNRLIKASINKIEFLLRESNFYGYPKGIFFLELIRKNWFFNENPASHLQFSKLFEKLKDLSQERYFENFIKQHLLNNPHNNLLILEPDADFVQNNSAAVKRELASIKAGLSSEEITSLVSETRAFREFQETPDNPDDLLTIPMLNIGNIDTKAKILPLYEDKIGNVKILSHSLFTNSITYLDLYFDTHSIQEQQISYIPLLAEVLGKLETSKYSSSEISNEINYHTGGITASPDIISEKDNDDKFYPKLRIRSKVFCGKLPKLFELLMEIICCSNLKQSNRLREIIQELRSKYEDDIGFSADRYAALRVKSYFSKFYNFLDQVEGISFFKFLVDIDDNFKEKESEIISNLISISNSILNKNNLLVSITSHEKDDPEFKRSVDDYLRELPFEIQGKEHYKLEALNSNEGIIFPSRVQYVARSYSYTKAGFEYSGSMNVLKRIISFNFLHQRIREQGGAYGVYPIFKRNGTICFVTYRDPHLKKTLNVFDKIAGFIDKFNASQREMTKFIIGAIGEIDRPLRANEKGARAAENYISHLTQGDIQKTRDEILSTTLKDIRNYAAMLNELAKQNYLTVIGNEEKINQNQDLFNSVYQLF